MYLAVSKDSTDDSGEQEGTVQVQMRLSEVTVSAALFTRCCLCWGVLLFADWKRKKTFSFFFSVVFIKSSWKYKCGHMWHLHETSVHAKSQCQSCLGQQCESLGHFLPRPSVSILSPPPLKYKHFHFLNTLTDTCLALLMRRCIFFFQIMLFYSLPVWPRLTYARQGVCSQPTAAYSCVLTAFDNIFYRR